jgi:Flp pilus assembly protein TadG
MTSSSFTGDEMLTRIAHRLKSLLGDTEGAVLVEFAVLAPVLVILGLGAAEIGRAVQHHHTIEKSARDAARYLSRVPASCASGVSAASITTAKNLAWTGYATGTAPLLSYWQDPGTNATITVTVDCFANDGATILNRANAASGSSIPLITVTIDVPYQDIGFLGMLGVTAFSMNGTHSEVSIGE